MKSGIKSSELWVSVCGVVATALIGLGVISADDADAIKTQGQVVIDGLIALTPAVIALWYTLCRTVLKRKEM